MRLSASWSRPPRCPRWTRSRPLSSPRRSRFLSTVTVLVPPRGPAGRADRGDRRRGVVGVLVVCGRRRGAVGGVVTVTFTVPVPDGAVTVSESRQSRRPRCPRSGPKSTAGRAPVEAGACHRDRCWSRPRARWSGLTAVTVGGGVVGVLVARRRRGAAGGRHRDVHRAGPRRDVDREASAELVTSTEVPAFGAEVDVVVAPSRSRCLSP